RRVSPRGDALGAHAARRAPAPRGDAHDVEGLRHGRGPGGLPRRGTRARRRAARRAPAVPPLGGHPGGRARGARARGRTHGSGRRVARRARRARRVAARAWAAGCRLGRELRDVRRVRQPAYALAGAARPRGAHPRGRAARMAAGVRGDPVRDGGVQGRPGGGGRTVTKRTARVERTTSESSVLVELDLDGTGRTEISTGVPFYDHMLTALGKHSLIDLRVQAEGDTHIDAHHTVEDVAICIGEALRTALGDKTGIARYGDATVPLDEALALAVVDVSGRPYLVHSGEPEA